MNTSEKIASVVAQFIAADREEDRKRIAELERDNAMLTIQANAMHEKCAALVVENKRLLDSTVRNHSGASLSMLIESELKASLREALVETPAVKSTPKVGDRVRIIKQIDHAEYGLAGEIGTVIGFEGDDVDVKGIGQGGGPWFHDLENLEVIE